jgi:hypothetical protein
MIGCYSIGCTYPGTIIDIKGSNPFVPIGYDKYKLRSKVCKGGMTLYHIGYIDVGKTLVYSIQMV